MILKIPTDFVVKEAFSFLAKEEVSDSNNPHQVCG